MTGPRGHLLLVLLAVVGAVGCACGGEEAREAEPARRDAGTERADSGSARSRDAGGRDAGSDPRRELERVIAGLTALIAGHLPAETDPQTLFTADPSSVSGARVERLRQSIEERARRLARLPAVVDGGSPRDAGPSRDGGPLADAGSSARAAVGSDAGDRAGADAGAPDGGSSDAGSSDAATSAGDAGAPALDPITIGGGEADLERLSLVRDRLRLRFLTLPEAERSAILEAVRERHRVAVEEEGSRIDGARARASAARAGRARQHALDRAAASRSAIDRALLGELARIESARASLARWEASLARERARIARRDVERLELEQEIEQWLAGGAGSAEPHYDRVLRVLRADRRQLGRVLDALTARSSVPRFEARTDWGRHLYRAARERVALEAALASLEREQARAQQLEDRSRWARADHLATHVNRLDALRLALLPRLPAARRSAILGLTHQGIEELGGEAQQAGLLGAFWLRSTARALPELPARGAEHLFLQPSKRAPLLAAILVLIGLIVLWRRREAATARLRDAVRAPGGARRFVSLVRPFWAVAGFCIVPLALVLGLHAWFALLASVVGSVVLDVARITAIGIAWFFLALTVVVRFSFSRLRQGATHARTARRVFGSLRLVLGFAFGVAVALKLCALLVGRGCIHDLVVDLAWIGSLPLAAALVYRWSEDIVRVHQERYPRGLCARVVAASQARWPRYAVTPLAAAHLSIAGTAAASKELALRFEQSRRAFAFLFRRKIEREVGAVSEPDPDQLPEPLAALFDGRPCDEALEVDGFAGLSEVVDRARAYVEGESGFTVALVGERGSGKTSWMRALARRVGPEAQVITPPRRMTEPAEVCRWLGAVLHVPGAAGVEEIVERVRASEAKRVLLVDQCQDLVVRAIGGAAALETLVEIAARTSTSVVWVCSFSRYTWMYLERARQAQDVFEKTVRLDAWPEARLAEAIEKRMSAAGVEASFTDMVIDALEGSALEDAVARTEAEYLRLLCSYSAGNPRVAMHFWLRSLVCMDDAVRVRLFARPDESALERLHEHSRFLLAAVVLHENMSEAEVARTSGLSHGQSAALLAYLAQQGYLEHDAGGVYRVSVTWYRAIVNHLMRRRLLFD